MLGKRKREMVFSHQSELIEPTESRIDHHQLFRQYFESRFEPLWEAEVQTPSLLEGSESDDGDLEGSEWEGFSEDDNYSSPKVEVVELAKPATTEADDVDRAELKSFMSSKPPREIGEHTKKSPREAVEEVDSETVNLKHDLDLQRLLKESHLLKQAKGSTELGTHRHKATDMRLTSLGSRSSLFGQEKMPLAHRKGIAAKAGSREAFRRKEAQENGIVLEKLMKSSVQPKGRRDRGVDAPSLGKFRGGTLKLSKDDIASIQGPRRPPGRAKGWVR